MKPSLRAAARARAVRAAQRQEWAAIFGAEFVDAMLAVPGLVAAAVAASTDAEEIRRILDEEIQRALVHLKDGAEA